MHIVVALKQVHDPDAPIAFLSVGPDGKSLALHSAAKFVLNAYDANAIEAAVQLKEAGAVTITALTVGNKESVAFLRRAIAMGADQAVHIDAESSATVDPSAIAALLAKAIAKLDPVDLVLCGRQASDSDGGVVPFYLAEALGAVAISPVTAVLEAAAGSVTVQRLGEAVTQTVRVALPAVLAVSNEANKPRVAGLKGIMLSKKSVIPSWTAQELEGDPATAALEVEGLSVVTRAVVDPLVLGGATGADAGRALADHLHREGFF